MFQYINDNNCNIIPLASTTRSLFYDDNNLQIVSINNNFNVQTWKLEKVNNGKFIFDGKYIIKDSLTNKYLYCSGNNIKLDNLYTVWDIKILDNNYYKISTPIEGDIKYLEAINAYEKEEYAIKLSKDSDNDYGQNWKFILNSDETVIIMPKFSIDKGLKCATTSSFILSKDFGAFILIKKNDS